MLICLDELSYLRYHFQYYQDYLTTTFGERYKCYPNFTDEKIKEKRDWIIYSSNLSGRGKGFILFYLTPKPELLVTIQRYL